MRYIGLMSGTSLDGVDAVVYDPKQHVLVASDFLPYPDTLKQLCQELMLADTFSFDMVSNVDNSLAALYANACRRVLDKLPHTTQIEAIGCHGQSIKHAIEASHPYSIQLGNPFLLAAEMGMPVVSHFRQKDIVLNGQGAPLAPLFHQCLFQMTPDKVVLNIGGIANISYLDKEGQIRGFDTGPGNVLLDEWIGYHHQKAYDTDGAWSREGEVSNALLAQFLNDPYFSRKPPKSLDKGYFSLAWLQSQTERLSLPPQDIQATLAQFTVQTIVDAINALVPSCSTLIVCGGGAKNAALMHGLRNDVAEVQTSDVMGYNSDYIEAMMIAWYAFRCVNQQASDLSTVTGSRKQAVLGSLVYP